MTADRSADYLAGLVRELCKLPHETEWLEFKVNNAAPQAIGEYLSALANAAACNGKAFAYLVWGVEDETHRIIGTRFAPAASKKGNEPLETWLLRLLTPKIHFRFHELTLEGRPVVLLEIGRAFRHPVRFQGEAFIRIGSVKKPLKGAPTASVNCGESSTRHLLRTLSPSSGLAPMRCCGCWIIRPISTCSNNRCRAIVMAFSMPWPTMV